LRSFVLVENEETNTTTIYDLHGVQLEFDDSPIRRGVTADSAELIAGWIVTVGYDSGSMSQPVGRWHRT
jgi:hypothetical protein